MKKRKNNITNQNDTKQIKFSMINYNEALKTKFITKYEALKSM